MRILITGADGYIGFPLALKIAEQRQGDQIIGVDNISRRRWVSEVGGKSLWPSSSSHFVLELADLWKDSRNNNQDGFLIRKEFANYKFVKGDLTDKRFTDWLMKQYKPHVIIHLASQPSMPYSQRDHDHALYTQENNIISNLNLLWSLKSKNLKDCQYIITTTTGIPGQIHTKVPEDYTVNAAGSWYHVSRGFDSANCRLAAMQWGLNISEFRTSIICGTRTKELSENHLKTRFDVDSYFGTVLHRFCHQAVNGLPLTIYGKGEQAKPFCSLEDCCASIANIVGKEGPNKHTILNQVTGHLSIKELAVMISKRTGVSVEHIDNPRKEKEAHQMTFENEKFLSVLGREPEEINKVIGEIIEDIKCGTKQTKH